MKLGVMTTVLPRPSIEERYQTRDQYLSLVSSAAKQLVETGYVLQEDVASIVEHAGRHWDLATSATGEASASR